MLAASGLPRGKPDHQTESGCAEACGGSSGSAGVLHEKDMLAIYSMANER